MGKRLGFNSDPEASTQSSIQFNVTAERIFSFFRLLDGNELYGPCQFLAQPCGRFQ